MLGAAVPPRRTLRADDRAPGSIMPIDHRRLTAGPWAKALPASFPSSASSLSSRWAGRAERGCCMDRAPAQRARGEAAACP